MAWSPWTNMDQRPRHSPGVFFYDTKDRLSDTAAHDQSEKSSVCRATF